MKREALIEIAASWVGTAYEHRQCVKGVAVDCAMLLVGVAEEAGLITPQQSQHLRQREYSRQWHLHRNEEVLRDTLESYGGFAIAPERALPGDIVLFRYGRVHAHAGILCEHRTVIHASAKAGKVLRQSLHALEFYEKRTGKTRLTLAYTFPWFEDRG